jgi:hypothetical protein
LAEGEGLTSNLLRFPQESATSIVGSKSPCEIPAPEAYQQRQTTFGSAAIRLSFLDDECTGRRGCRCARRGGPQTGSGNTKADVCPGSCQRPLEPRLRLLQRRDQAQDRGRRHLPNEAAITRLVGAILLEQNDEWASNAPATSRWKASHRSAMIQWSACQPWPPEQPGQAGHRGGYPKLHHRQGHNPGTHWLAPHARTGHNPLRVARGEVNEIHRRVEIIASRRGIAFIDCRKVTCRE